MASIKSLLRPAQAGLGGWNGSRRRLVMERAKRCLGFAREAKLRSAERVEIELRTVLAACSREYAKKRRKIPTVDTRVSGFPGT
jgi:hypothetical protein